MRRSTVDSSTESFFKQSAEHWNELNLAARYTDFIRKCSPLAQTLPMILYNADKIFELLETACLEADEHSAQSLLDLLVNFARDLGADFEPYYERTLTVCLRLIEKYQKTDEKLVIVESAFNCLAYVFKYLSRLLTTNLIPTYTVLSPLFGGSKQRHYVLRFAAESMAFLLRRCKADSLRSIVEFIVEGIVKSPAKNSQQQLSSSAMLLADSLKGPNISLHSKAKDLLSVYLSVCVEKDCTELAAMLLVDVLHHVRKDTSPPIYEVAVPFGTRKPILVFVLAGLRKGDRVPDFRPLFESLLSCDQRTEVEWVSTWALAAAALVGYADLASLHKYFEKLMQCAPSPEAAALVLELVHAHKPEALPTLLPKVPRLGVQLDALLCIDVGRNPPLLSNFEVDLSSPEGLFQLWLGLKCECDISAIRILPQLLEIEDQQSKLLSVVTSSVFEMAGEPEKYLAPMITRLSFTPKLLLSASQYAEAIFNSPHLDNCLSSCDSSLRSAALRSISLLDEHDLIQQSLVLNDLPVDLEHARDINNRLRQLALRCSSSAKLRRAIVAFFFGMLTTRLQPVWTAVIEHIPVVAETCSKEVCEFAVRFVEDEMKQSASSIDNVVLESSARNFDLPLSWDLDCANLQRIEETHDRLLGDILDPEWGLKKRCKTEIETVHYDDLFFLGLKALSAVPKAAERYTCDTLVPLLLASNESEYQRSEALLGLFSKFTKQHQRPSHEAVKNKYLFFLASRHVPLQRLSLTCLLNLPEFAQQRKYKETLKALLDDSQFREQITLLTSEGEQTLHEDDRTGMIPFLSRILYGRAVGGGKRNMRNAALNALHSLPQCLPVFVSLAHEHLSRVFKSDEPSCPDDFGSENVGNAVAENATSGLNLQSRRLSGYLSLMLDLVRVLQSACETVALEICTMGIFPVLECVSPANEDRALRQLATKTLTEMLSSAPNEELWLPLTRRIRNLLIPRLEDFGLLNKETPSTVLKFYIAASCEPQLTGIVPGEFVLACISCLSYDTVKEPVIQHVLRLMLNMASNSTGNVAGAAELLKLLPGQLNRELESETLSLAVQCVSKLYSSIDSSTVADLSIVSLKLLQQPSRLVSLHVKSEVLDAFAKVLTVKSDALSIGDVADLAYTQLAPLFRVFVAREARERLVACYSALGSMNHTRSRVAKLLAELNSYDDTRLGEPDFGRRSDAFEQITQGSDYEEQINQDEWLPLLSCMLFFLKDPEEVVLRNNAKHAICRFVEQWPECPLVESVLLPAVLKGLREPDDKFRKLYVDILGQLARSKVLPMEPLLFRGDEEADFFINIVHAQIHRRRRAMQRLGKLAVELDSSVVVYLIALVENLCMLSGSKSGDLNNLADDSLKALTCLLRRLTPGQYKSIARRWVRNIKSSEDKTAMRRGVRILSSIAEAATGSVETRLDSRDILFIVQQIHEVLTRKANEHDDLPDRIPLAVSIVQFLITLPADELELALPGKLTTLCQLLRARQPEMRDAARETLGKIVRVLPVKYLHFVISEVKGALIRGGLQRHILGYTIHYLLAILAQNNSLMPSNLDDSAEMIIDSVLDDILGSVGEEKDNENYLTDAKEVKQHKSYDTAEILASNVSLSRFGTVIGRIRFQLSTKKLTTRLQHKGDQLMTHIATGLRRNVEFQTQSAVVLGYTTFVECENAANGYDAEDQVAPPISGALAAREKAKLESEQFFTLQLRAPKTRGKELGNIHLLEAFALNLLRSILTSTAGGSAGSGKGLLTPANVRGLAPVVARAMHSTHEDVQIAAMRLATTCLRVPVDLGDVIADVGNQAFAIFESCPETASLVCQASVKLLTVLIRIPEYDMPVAYVTSLLEHLQADLDEPDRQSAAMSFARAVFGSSIMLPQVYAFADRLSEVLVQNQSDHIRLNSRQAYLQFLSTYPLGQARLDKHLARLAGNLRYASSAGRLSAMEMIGMLLHKVRSDQIESAFVQFYANLVLALVSDSEPACRSRAAELLRELIDAASTSTVDEMVTYCCTWLASYENSSNTLVVRGGLEVAPLLLPHASRLQKEKLDSLFSSVSLEILRAATKQSGKDNSDLRADWQLVYLALGSEVADVSLLRDVLLFPHSWVRARATRSVQKVLKVTDVSADELYQVGRRTLRQLAAPRVTEQDAKDSVKVLVYVVSRISSEDAKKLISKLCLLIRTDITAADFVEGKTGAVQFLMLLPEVFPSETLALYAPEIIRSLVVCMDQLEAENALDSLHRLSQETLDVWERKLGSSVYLKLYGDVKRQVQQTRMDRRAKRSIETVTNPELAARKRIKKNKRGNRA